MASNKSPIGLNKVQNYWMRTLKIKLYSKLYNVAPLIFGYNDEMTDDEKRKFPNANINQLDITVTSSKELSALKDGGTITISNLTYADIVRIIEGQFYKVEIYVGYKTTGMMCFAKGEIAYISNKIRMRRDHTCIIIFASEFVAQYSQGRINLNYNSGINLYSAFKYLFLTNGISNTHLPESLKQETLKDITSLSGTCASLSEQLANNTRDFSLNTDSSAENIVIDCSNLSDKRQIKIDSHTINFRNGNPTLSSNGLNISVMPLWNFKPGDIIIIDNAIIDLSESSLSGAQSNFKANYLDQDGAYIITKVENQFQNRGSSFECNLIAYSIHKISNIIGGTVT